MKNLILTCMVAMASLALEAQTVAIVDYMKVPENGQAAYLAVEKQWKPLHQNLVNEGRMLGWELYAVWNAGSSSPYNFATVRIFENFSKTEQQFSEADFKKAFGTKMNEIMNATGASRSLIYSEMYHMRLSIMPDVPDKFIVVNSIHTDNLDNYLNMEKVAFQPLHEESKKLGQRNSWGIWVRWPNEDNSIQAVTVDGFAKFSDINAVSYSDAIDKVFSGKKADEIIPIAQQLIKTEELRTIVKSEIWQMVDATTSNK